MSASKCPSPGCPHYEKSNDFSIGNPCRCLQDVLAEALRFEADRVRECVAGRHDWHDLGIYKECRLCGLRLG